MRVLTHYRLEQAKGKTESLVQSLEKAIERLEEDVRRAEQSQLTLQSAIQRKRVEIAQLRDKVQQFVTLKKDIESTTINQS